jgi:hypothetical protein
VTKDRRAVSGDRFTELDAIAQRLLLRDSSFARQRPLAMPRRRDSADRPLPRLRLLSSGGEDVRGAEALERYDVRRRAEVLPTCLLETWRQQREGDADLSSGTRDAKAMTSSRRRIHEWGSARR